MRGGRYGDEELRAISAGACVCHCEHVGFAEGQFWVEFIFELVAGAASAGAERVATLNHEPIDDAVEDYALVKRFRGGLTVGRV